VGMAGSRLSISSVGSSIDGSVVGVGVEGGQKMVSFQILLFCFCFSSFWS
jgi:hypothetical protein